MDSRRVLPTDIDPERGARRLRLATPTMRITRKSRGSSKGPDDPSTAYNVNSVDKLLEAFEERERSLGDGPRSA